MLAFLATVAVSTAQAEPIINAAPVIASLPVAVTPVAPESASVKSPPVVAVSATKAVTHEAPASVIVATAEPQKSEFPAFGLQFDISAYVALLEELKLTDSQLKVWQGVLMAYELKAMEWPYYHNILGTLETNRRELDAVMAKLDTLPAEIKENKSIQLTMIMPRKFAVEAFEKLYATLTTEQIAKYEVHIYKMIVAQAKLPDSAEEAK